MSKNEKAFDGYSDIQGKLWKVWEGDILSVEEKIAQTFDADQRKEFQALDSALKRGLVRTTDKVMLIVVANLEKTQVILNWKEKFDKKPKVGERHLMFYGRFGYTFPDLSFKKNLLAGVQK